MPLSAALIRVPQMVSATIWLRTWWLALCLVAVICSNGRAQMGTTIEGMDVAISGPQLKPEQVPASLIESAKTRIPDPLDAPKAGVTGVSISHEWYVAQPEGSRFAGADNLYYHSYIHRLNYENNRQVLWFVIREVYDNHGDHSHLLKFDMAFGDENAAAHFLPEGLYNMIMADVHTRAESDDLMLHLLYQDHDEMLFVEERQWQHNNDWPDVIIEHRYGIDGLYIDSIKQMED